MNKLIISIDFDNTIFEDNYPNIGAIIPGARDVINYLHDQGHKIIINTCREGIAAESAMSALNSNGIKWDLFNTNDLDRVRKYECDSRKIGADIYIEDKSFPTLLKRRTVDWAEVARDIDLYLNKRIIVCIVGESGSGKTYLAEYFRGNYDVPMIESYTDRAKRGNDEVGHTFLTSEGFDLLDMSDMIAYTSWIQGDGSIGRYCCMVDDVMPGINTYVIDERGLNYLRRYWSSVFTIFAVRMFAPDHKRIERVGEDRVNRDKGNFSLSDKHFDSFIYNDYTDNMHSKYDALYERIKQL